MGGYADVPAEQVSMQVCLRSLGWRAVQILDTPDGEYYRFEKRPLQSRFRTVSLA